ncbi:cytochrome b/b6 domain-containing protein [Arthrobacter sp. PAMC 25486]|uniref:cytochrome b/b6 domain-containing protein n=1 Tax=Arthrobacter sp. PAMC 25486 TaxID=1494608 RepID=UPI00056FD86E|nr:cytochrome b/b6 domain-containing protein [Arthrobacter sp. PAMC 25486]
MGPYARKTILTTAVVVAMVAVVLAAKWLRSSGVIDGFLADYPGHARLPETSPTGFPAWLGWQHFLNMFFLVLIIRSGWQVRRTTRPDAYWTRHNKGFIRTKGSPAKISLDLWLHLSVDILWLINGLVFVILLGVTGHWMRIVPTSWDVIPNALSAAVQYASLDWPTEDSWISYNALQLLAYFLVVFVAAPLAFATGVRMSGIWPQQAARLNRAYPIAVARSVHFPVMVFFVLFVVVHVFLVLTTGVLRNLNHIYAGTDDAGWLGFGLFVGSLVVISATVVLARPVFLRPVASLMGKVSKR